jgi:hypothetical protein
MRTVYLMILCCFVSGCAYQTVLRPSSPPEDFTKTNQAVRSLVCQIELADTTLKGQTHVRIGSDPIRWDDPTSAAAQQVAFPMMRSIKATDHNKGLVPGALIGLLAGTLVGGAVGAAHVRNTAQSGQWFLFGDVGGAIALGFGVGIPIFIASVVAGYSIGARVEVYNVAYLDARSPLRGR